MPMVGGLDIHRKQLTFDYPGTVTGEVRRGQIAPADREHLRAGLARFADRDDVAFAMEGCTGWRYVAAASLQDPGQQAAESVKATAAAAAATVKDEAVSSAHDVRDQAQTARDTVTDSRH
jgi:hypothetical protein